MGRVKHKYAYFTRPIFMCIQALQPSVRIPACLLFAQFHHSSDAFSGTFNHILRQLDFFSAAAFQTVINIHQCCDLHIHTCQWNSQRIEGLVRTIKLQMFYNTVFRSDNKFSAVRFLGSYSRGMGALGLPGDLSSSSRFVRVAFVKMNALSGNSEVESVNQVFHIMGSVEQQRGCCEVSEGHYEITIYTACMNVSKGIYYYTTYTNHQITAVDMQKENLNGEMLVRYPMLQEEKILIQN